MRQVDDLNQKISNCLLTWAVAGKIIYLERLGRRWKSTVGEKGGLRMFFGIAASGCRHNFADQISNATGVAFAKAFRISYVAGKEVIIMLRRKAIAAAVAAALLTVGGTSLALATEDTATTPAVVPVGEQSAFLHAPRSLRSLVDERREALQRSRDRAFDAMIGYDPFLPGLAVQRKTRDDYRHALRELHRKRMDASRLWQDTWTGYYSPWSRSFREWTEARHYAMQMAQLDRQELFDDLTFNYPLFGPAAWHPFVYRPLVVGVAPTVQATEPAAEAETVEK